MLFFSKKKPPVTSAPAVAAVADTGVSLEHARVVAAAALHTALKDNSLLPVILAAAAQAVDDVPAVLHLAPSDTLWSLEGRRAIFASHALRR